MQQLHGIETGFPVLCSTSPSDGYACSAGKIWVTESNSGLVHVWNLKRFLEWFWCRYFLFFFLVAFCWILDLLRLCEIHHPFDERFTR